MNPMDVQTEEFIASLGYISPSEDAIARIAVIRDQTQALVGAVGSRAGSSRERSLAYTHFETAMQYAIKAIILDDRGR